MPLGQMTLTMLAEALDPLLIDLTKTVAEVRYGNQTQPYTDAIVIRYAYTFGFKYCVKLIDRLGREGSGAYFNADEVEAVKAYVLKRVEEHHTPHSNQHIRAIVAKAHIEGKVPCLGFYTRPRVAPFNEAEELRAHGWRMNSLTVEADDSFSTIK